VTGVEFYARRLGLTLGLAAVVLVTKVQLKVQTLCLESDFGLEWRFPVDYLSEELI
jgi:hypothetical protein